MTTNIAHGQYPQRRPNGLWRGSSAMVMGLTGALSKGFLNGLNDLEVVGLDNFMKILESRTDPFERQRGLITVTKSIASRLVSHVFTSLDDPLMWGVLPLRYAFEPWNLRWGLGAHDICFKNKALSTFFTLGQVLPIHRNMHSQHAGLFQPSMTQAVRLLSAYPFKTTGEHLGPGTAPEQPRTVTTQSLLQDLRDPFSDGSLTYSTNGRDVHTAPSAFLSNRHAWVHAFPEGLVHQHPERQMRYFKWGVARLILEAEPMPDLVPVFIDGTSDIMNENRTWPRAVPRPGKKVRVAFGDKVDMEATFGDLRARWKALVRREMDIREAEIAAVERQIAAAAAPRAKVAPDSGRTGIVAALPKTPSIKKPDVLRVGELPDELKYSKEAQEIRIEVASRVRNEVLKLRKSLGYPDEDPAWGFGRAETWAKDPKDTKKSPVDGSIEKPST
ncbi:Lysophosphatidylcholine acyltransferase [Cytospora mali]|uniref:Tafazzin family protein n=1 Tax=Cytospora mali TaxID=578113 RepID=A0A194V971_CYTMA|nr:Lysophosphatidylcholine acyltransferase [Valsa mali var. pyri (nom. inval.)]